MLKDGETLEVVAVETTRIYLNSVWKLFRKESVVKGFRKKQK